MTKFWWWEVSALTSIVLHNWRSDCYTHAEALSELFHLGHTIKEATKLLEGARE